MEAFFSGTVIVLYFLARFAAEPIYVAACFLPTIYALAVMLSLRFGGCGRVIAAWRALRRLSLNGVVAGDRKDRLCEKYVKRTPVAFRSAYALFLNGGMEAAELASVGVRCVRFRRGMIKGGSVGIGALSTLSVFLIFYFAVPIGETLVRAGICAFQAAIGGVVLHFSLYAYALRGERAAAKFAEMADRVILREKRIEGVVKSGVETSTPSFAEERQNAPLVDAREDDVVRSLKEMIRDLERRAL